VVPSGDTAAGAKCDAVWFSPRKKRRRRRRRRSTGWRRKRRRWRRRAAAMASVTGHCIWFHGKWAQSYSWVEIVKISRGYPPLNWIAATCVYPLSSSSVRLSLSLSLARAFCIVPFDSFPCVSLSRQLRRFISTLLTRSRALVSDATIARTRRNRRSPARRKKQARRNAAKFHRGEREEDRENGASPRGFARATPETLFFFMSLKFQKSRRVNSYSRISRWNVRSVFVFLHSLNWCTRCNELKWNKHTFIQRVQE